MTTPDPFPLGSLPSETQAHLALATSVHELLAGARDWVRRLADTARQPPWSVRLSPTSASVSWSVGRDKAGGDAVDAGGYWATTAADPNGARTVWYLHGGLAAELVSGVTGERPVARMLLATEQAVIDALWLDVLARARADAPARMLMRSDNALGHPLLVFRRDEALVCVNVGIQAEPIQQTGGGGPEGHVVQGALRLIIPLAEVPSWCLTEGQTPALPWSMMLSVGQVPASALRALEPGAVCVPASLPQEGVETAPPFRTVGELRLAQASMSLRLPVAWESREGSWCVRLSAAQPENRHTSAHATDQADAEGSFDRPLDEAPVELAFEIGKRSLRLDDLRRLQRGEVVDMEVPFAHPVTVLAAGSPVGFGELVEVSKTLGVRLLELYGADATPTSWKAQ